KTGHADRGSSTRKGAAPPNGDLGDQQGAASLPLDAGDPGRDGSIARLNRVERLCGSPSAHLDPTGAALKSP
ncbi:hypothetical protein, partial [Microvirga massiliensis]|uniref:hypothetical protein n=1 Tax=Microvirga massiliensis TaxID=1033741 RepID=UPI00062B8798